MQVFVLRCALAAAFFLAVGSSPSACQQPPSPSPPFGHTDAEIAFRFGTLGLGPEVGKLLTGHLSVRAAATYFKVSTSKAQSDITYDANVKLHSLSLLLDVYPARRGAFRLTGGVVTNPLTASGTGQPSASGTFEINNHVYSNAQIGTLVADAGFPSVGPYLGLGVGTPARNHPLVFLFDLGAVIGQPHVSLTATGAAQNAQLRADLETQAEKTQQDVRKFLKLFPVLSLGLGYRI